MQSHDQRLVLTSQRSKIKYLFESGLKKVSIMEYFVKRVRASMRACVVSQLFYSKILSKWKECSNIRSSVNPSLFEPL